MIKKKFLRATRECALYVSKNKNQIFRLLIRYNAKKMEHYFSSAEAVDGTINLKLYVQGNIYFKNKGEMKTFSYKQNLKKIHF